MVTHGICESCGTPNTDLANGLCGSCWDNGGNTQRSTKTQTKSATPPILKPSRRGRPRKFQIGDTVIVNKWAPKHNTHKGVIIDTLKLSRSYHVKCECGVMRYWDTTRLDLLAWTYIGG